MRTSLRMVCLLLTAAMMWLSGCAQQGAPAGTTPPPVLHATATPAPTLDNEPAITYSGVFTDKRVVSLILEGYTDDDSMRAIASEIRRMGAPCVFFISGSDANEHPDVVKEIADAGFEIGNYGIHAGKNMQLNDVNTNIHQFQRGQELLAAVIGVRPTLFRCNGSEYTEDVRKAAAFAGLRSGVIPGAYLNHLSFHKESDAALFVSRMTRGTIITIKLGQALSEGEYGGTSADEEVAVDPQPFISDDMSETIRQTYKNAPNVVVWLLSALSAEGYTIVSPEALQAQRLTAFDSPNDLDESTKAMLDPATHDLPLTNVPLGVPASASADPAAMDGVVFVGDSIVSGVEDYVDWRRESDPTYLSGAQFLTSTNLGVIAAQSRVTTTSVHPAVDGQKMAVNDALAKLGAKVVYLTPGLSDARNLTHDKLIDNLKLLVYEIRSSIPDVRIRMVSVPPGVAGRYGEPTNTQVFACNLAVAKFCLQYDIPFVDAAFALRDANGDLPEELCIDPDAYGIHLNDAGCETWIGYLLSHMPA